MANFMGRYKRFLVLFIIIFCIFAIKNNVFATTETFDSYADNYKINNVPNWASSTDLCLVSNDYFSSSPNSLKSKYSFGYATCEYNQNSNIKSVIFSINDIDNLYNGGQIYFKNNTHYITVLHINNDYPKQEITLSVGSNKYHLASTTNNSWYNVYLEFSDTYIKAKVDLNDWTTVSTTTENITGFQFTSLSTNYSSPGVFLDDLTITGEPENDVIFINPINSSIQSLNDFYWEYNFKIKDSSYWTTYDFLNVDLIFVHYTNSIPDATTTLSVLRSPINTFVPQTYYNYQITDINSFPTQLGAYQAIIATKGVYSNGTTDTLAYDTVTFGIATTTPITPTGWCTGLCDDIATSTGWIGQISNGVNCAFRSATCYLFSPHQYNLDQFNTQYNNFKLVFPFNTFFDLSSSTKNAFASSTINSNQTFGLPNIKKVGTTTQYYIQPLLSSSTMSSFIGSSNATLFRTTISFLLYGLLASGILLILW